MMTRSEQVHELQRKAREPLMAESDAVTAAHNTETIAAKMVEGMSLEAATQQVIGVGYELSAGYLIDFYELDVKVTLLEIASNPAHFDGQECCDPDDGTHRAKFYWNKGHSPLISSFAHGRTNYEFERNAAMEARHLARRLAKGSEGLTEPEPETTALSVDQSITLEGFLIQQNKDKSYRLVTASNARAELLKHFKGRYAYKAEFKDMLQFVGTHYQTGADAAFDTDLLKALDIGTYPLGFSSRYNEDIDKQIKKSGALKMPVLQEKHLLPFLNGIVNLETGILTEATPDYALDWVLPYHFDSQAECPTIERFLLESVGGDEQMVVYLLAWLAAILFGRADLQKFLYLQGLAGTGKGTLVRLCCALVGTLNVHHTTLLGLEKDQFELANIYRKRLVVLNDAAHWGGHVGNITRLTGQDELPAKSKNIQKAPSYVYGGIVVATSNNALRTKGSTSGIERRLCVVSFDNPVSESLKADWASRGGEAAVLHAEIPGLINP